MLHTSWSRNQGSITGAGIDPSVRSSHSGSRVHTRRTILWRDAQQKMGTARPVPYSNRTLHYATCMYVCMFVCMYITFTLITHTHAGIYDKSFQQTVYPPRVLMGHGDGIS
jgi:hypothetical protein